jgi:hypothetical protein
MRRPSSRTPLPYRTGHFSPSLGFGISGKVTLRAAPLLQHPTRLPLAHPVLSARTFHDAPASLRVSHVQLSLLCAARGGREAWFLYRNEVGRLRHYAHLLNCNGSMLWYPLHPEAEGNS